MKAQGQCDLAAPQQEKAACLEVLLAEPVVRPTPMQSALYVATAALKAVVGRMVTSGLVVSLASTLQGVETP